MFDNTTTLFIVPIVLLSLFSIIFSIRRKRTSRKYKIKKFYRIGKTNSADRVASFVFSMIVKLGWLK